MDEAMLEIMRKRWEFAAACGDEVNKAIPLYEDPTRYPVEALIALFKLQQEMMDAPTPEERSELKAKFSEMRRSIRLLPGAPEELIGKLEDNIFLMDQLTTILDEDGPEEVLNQVLRGLEPRILDRESVEYRCYCSRERVQTALLSIGADELRAMAEEGKPAEVTCQFCDKVYRFETDDLLDMLRRANTPVDEGND